MSAEEQSTTPVAARSVRALCWIGLIGIAAIAVMRCAIFFAPQLVFDVDPVIDATPVGGSGPAGSLILDALLMLAGGVALLGVALERRGIDWRLLVLALLPVPIALWHGWDDLDRLWRGMTWCSAAIAACAAAHLAIDGKRRLVLLALLAAVIGPLLLRGICNITYEHDDRIRRFEANKLTFLMEKGWAPDSPAAQIYERRLRQREPTGWFLTTNIFGSMMAFGLVLCTGLTACAARGKLSSGWVGLIALFAIACGAGLIFTGSKGAGIGAVAGLVALVVLLAGAARVTWLSRAAPGLAVLCVVAALGAVFARGVVLPEGFAGDVSLLYRWHYLTASSEIVLDEPLTGVGPGGFQSAYIQHRPPRNPEEVASAHSIFADWLTSLGVLGAAWIGLALVLLCRAGQTESRRDIDDDEPPMRAMWLPVLCVTSFGLVPAIVFERHTLGELDLMMRGLGVVAFIVCALVLLFVARGGVWLRWSIAAAAMALLVHGQIEMTFTQPGSAVWAVTLLGVAGGARCSGRGQPGLACVSGAIPVVLAVLVFALGAIPAWRAEATMAQAAARLHPIARADGALRTLGQQQLVSARRQAGTELRTALLELGVGADDLATFGLGPTFDASTNIAPDAWQRLIDLVTGMTRVRRLDAAEILLDLEDVRLRWDAPLEAAANQFERAARVERGDERVGLLEEASRVAQLAWHRHQSRGAGSLAVLTEDKLSELTRDTSHRERAIELARELADADPNGIQPWRSLGDLLWEAGRVSEAKDAYGRALEADAHFVLDPLKRLTGQRRAEIESRVGQRGPTE